MPEFIPSKQKQLEQSRRTSRLGYTSGLNRFRCVAAAIWSITLASVCFASQTISVRDYGAVGGGVSVETKAFQTALDAVANAGGGEVVVPAGKYRVGSIAIGSNTTLQIDANAEIIGSPDLADYPIVRGRWEGHWVDVHRALLSATDAHDIAIIGKGSISADPSLGGRQQPRQPCVIELIRCKGIRLEAFTAHQQRMWTIHPTLCERLHIDGLTIRSVGGNGDGIDLDSCSGATIENCDIDTGDDCISLKSGRGREGFLEAKPTENVTIRNCTLGDSLFACIGIGSETSGGIRNVKIEYITCTHAKTFALYIKSRTDRGAFIENIDVSNVTVKSADGGFLRFNLTRSGIADSDPVTGDAGIPASKGFSFRDIKLEQCGSIVDGVNVPPDKPLRGFTLTGVTGTATKGIALANIADAKLERIDVQITQGPKLATRNVDGDGLADAVPLPPPATTQAR